MSTSPRRASLAIIFVTVFIDLLGFGIVLPLLPRYAKHFQADDRTLGLLMASFSAMQFLFAPIWGRVSDRVGRRPILILGLAGSAFFYGLFGYCTSLGADGTLLGVGVLPWLFICRIGAGIAGATIPTAQAYIADVTGPKERAKGMALIGAAFGIGFTFGPLLGAAFVPSGPVVTGVTEYPTLTAVNIEEADSTPSAAPGYVASALSGLALLSAIFLLPESLQPGSRAEARHWLDTRSLKAALAQPSIGLILLTMFLTTLAFAQFESTLSLLTADLGLPDRSNYLVFAYIGFILTLSQGVLVRRLAPRLGEFIMSVAGTLLMTAGLLLVGVSGHLGSRPLLYWVLPISVIGFSALNPSLQSLLSRRTGASEQGGILGLGQSMAALARILGPVVGMSLRKQDPLWPYWAAAALMTVGVVLSLALRDSQVQPADRGA